MNKKRLKKNKKQLIQIFIFFSIGLLFVYKTYIYQSFKFHIIGAEKSLLIDTKNTDFFWGVSENFPNMNLKNTVPLKIKNYESFLGKKQTFGKSSFTVLSKNTGIFSQSQKKILFFDSNFNENELSTMFSSPINLTADFWVSVTSNIPLTKLSPPKKGVLYLGSKIPGKKIQEFCRKNKIPLITYLNTNGFRISLNQKNSWEIFTEN